MLGLTLYWGLEVILVILGLTLVTDRGSLSSAVRRDRDPDEPVPLEDLLQIRALGAVLLLLCLAGAIDAVR